MRIPCARHPANHLLAQELAIAASLSHIHSTSSCNSGDAGSFHLYHAAKRLAHLPMSCEEAFSFSPFISPVQRLDPFVLGLLRRRMTDLTTQPPNGGAPRLSVMAPSRLLALSGPNSPLPPLPGYVHNPVSYEAACHHQRLLQKLLAPYGFRVSLSGAARRGCPVGRQLSLMLALTQEATADLEGAPGGEDQETAEVLPQRRRRRPSTRIHRDALAIPQVQTVAGLRDTPVAAYPTQPCTRQEAAAIEDTVDARVAHRYHRALQGLCGCGYLVAGTLPRGPAVWCRRQTRGKYFSFRYDTQDPTTAPPRHLLNDDRLRSLELHHVLLDIVPWHSYHVRRLLGTGPAAFTAHLTLKGLQLGLELTRNGLFLCTSAGDGSVTDMSCHRVIVQSEKDIFALVGMPYVHPINRGLYCQEHHLGKDGGCDGP